MEQEERLWIQNKLPDNYSHQDLMELGRVTYNNLIDKDYDLSKNVEKYQPKAEEQRNFLALATEILKKFENGSRKREIIMAITTKGLRIITRKEYSNLGATKTQIMRKRRKLEVQPCSGAKMTVTKKQCGVTGETV